MKTEIIQITSCCDSRGKTHILGLGKDQKIYFWFSMTGEWVLYKQD